jgi:hypothetical protein
MGLSYSGLVFFLKGYILCAIQSMNPVYNSLMNANLGFMGLSWSRHGLLAWDRLYPMRYQHPPCEMKIDINWNTPKANENCRPRPHGIYLPHENFSFWKQNTKLISRSNSYCCIPQAQLKLYLSKDITCQNASIFHVSPGMRMNYTPIYFRFLWGFLLGQGWRKLFTSMPAIFDEL